MAQFQSTFHNGGYAVRVVYTVNSQSAANNTSNVTVEAHLVSLKSSYNISASATKNGSLVINGTTYNFTFNATLSSLQDKKVYTTTVTIPHNSDGTKSFSISCTLGINVTLSGTKYTKVSTSDTITLTTIPRTTPVSTSGTAKFGATITITHTRASTAFSITLRYACGSASGTIITKQATNSTSWTVPKSLQSQIPKSTSIPITIYCDTYSGNTLIGTTSTSYTCSIADDCNPSLTTLSCKNPDTGGSTYYQGVSKLRVEVGYNQAYSSPITKFVMVVDGQSITNYSYIIGTGVLRNSGAKDVKLTITDARGRTATKTWTSAITVTAYSAPKINSFTCKRMGVDEDGNTVISNLGTKGYFSYSISWHSSSTSKVRKFYYKPNASSSWTTVNLSSDRYNDYNFNNSLASGSGYDLKLEISDQVTTVSQTIQMPYLFPLINLSADGTAIAFGKECNASNRFMVSMDASFNNNTKIYNVEFTGNARFNYGAKFYGMADDTQYTEIYGRDIRQNGKVSMVGFDDYLALNYANARAYTEIHGRLDIRNRGGSIQMMRILTSGDGNRYGDGETHFGYYDSNLGGYSHYLRGNGKTYISTYNGLHVDTDVTVGQYLRSDWLGYASASGWDGNWGIGCSSHIYPTSTGRYLGTSAHRWHSAFLTAAPNVSSDARKKENVKYMSYPPEETSAYTNVLDNDEITTADLLEFVKNDLYMATYDYKLDTDGMEDAEKEQVTAMNSRQIGFVAQDIKDSKVGKYLITEDNQGILGYETANWTSIIAGALQHEIRTREAETKALREIITDIINS